MPEVVVRKTLPTRQDLPNTDWEPLRTLRVRLNLGAIRDVRPVWRRFARIFGYAPAFEVNETRDSYVLYADLPGVKEDDLDICLAPTSLSIKGQRKKDAAGVSHRYFSERPSGSFARSFTLPEGIDVQHARADLDAGVLSLSIPKTPDRPPEG
jgi:HSP20 family protein